MRPVYRSGISFQLERSRLERSFIFYAGVKVAQAVGSDLTNP